jgi:competence protein ComEA
LSSFHSNPIHTTWPLDYLKRAGEQAASQAKLGAGPADAGAPAPDGGPTSSGITADGKVILNLATEDDLRRLSGIGPAKAKAILALRAKLGRFKRVEDLLRVKGIGRKRLARLRPLVVLDPQPSP